MVFLDSFLILKFQMLHGKIVVIKRSGTDGAQFPLTADTCVFGRYGSLNRIIGKQ